MKGQTKRDYLRELVLAKGQSFRPLTSEERALGFLGWHERGYLPHSDYPGLVQLVTFRLGDSLPASRRGEWEHLLRIEDVREKRVKLEEYLDRGAGQCWLGDPAIATIAEGALLYFHLQRYELLAWVVMPNHIHVLVHVWRTPLWKIVGSWKKFIATTADPLLSERRSPARQADAISECGPYRKQVLRWEREYWDTFMQDDEQEKRSIRYIENNPVKAKLCRTNDAWPFSSARRRDLQTLELRIP